jgi:actin-like ATPase involved in cell morphogenesis
MSAFVALPHSVAIDFGASATKSAWRDKDGVVHLVHFGKAGQFDSVAYVNADLSISVHSAGDSRRQLYGVKQRIGEPGSPLLERAIPVGAGDESVQLIEPTSAILAHALARCREACGVGANGAGTWEEVPLVLTHPVLWGEPERQFLSEAISMSSLPLRRGSAPIHFVTEPEAACAYAVSQGLASFADGPIAVFDIGAATLDVAVIAGDGDDSVTLASDGRFSGGDDLDNALLRLVERRLRTEGGVGASAAFLQACREQPYSARGEARKTKERLSTDPECTFAATLAGDGNSDGTNVDVEIERDEFEEETGSILDGWVALLGECLASLPPARTLGTILCSGGTALIPALQRRLDDIAQEVGARIVIARSKKIGPGQCIAPGALDVLLARETARLREEERQRVEEEERREARRRRERRIRRHNEDIIDDAIRNSSSLRGRADALLERLPSDEELIRVIRFTAYQGLGILSFLSDYSLMALSHYRMTIEPELGDGWWRPSEVDYYTHGMMNNIVVQFRNKDRLWIGTISASEREAISEWADGNLY